MTTAPSAIVTGAFLGIGNEGQEGVEWRRHAGEACLMQQCPCKKTLALADDSTLMRRLLGVVAHGEIAVARVQ